MCLIDLLHYTNPREKNQGAEKASGLPFSRSLFQSFSHWWPHYSCKEIKQTLYFVLSFFMSVDCSNWGAKSDFVESWCYSPCPTDRLHSWNSAWDNERVVNYSYGNPHDFCYRSCYCTQAAQDKMWLSFSQKERQSSESHAQTQSCSTSELFLCASSSYNPLGDFQVYCFCFYISEMLSCNFEIDSFLYNMPSQLSAWDHKWKCTGILGEKCFSV